MQDSSESLKHIYVIAKGQLLLKKKITADENSSCFKKQSKQTAKKLVPFINQLSIPLIISGKHEVIDDVLFEPDTKLHISCESSSAVVFKIKTDVLFYFLPFLYQYILETNKTKFELRLDRNSKIVNSIVDNLVKQLNLTNNNVDELQSSEKHVVGLKKLVFNGNQVVLNNLERELNKNELLKNEPTKEKKNEPKNGNYLDAFLSNINKKNFEKNDATNYFRPRFFEKRLKMSLHQIKYDNDQIISKKENCGLRIRTIGAKVLTGKEV